MPKETALRMIRAHGADKILFGTDFPVARHKTEIEYIASLKLAGEEYRQILGENILRFLEL